MNAADPQTRTLPMHIVIVGAWMRFPLGMASTSRVRLLARTLTEAGAHVRVVCLQASERPPHVENTAVRGKWQGVPFEYMTWTTVRHESFGMRRLIAAWGWMHGACRLMQLRRQGALDAVYLWSWAPRPRLHRYMLLALFRLLGVPVVSELNEQPWSLRDDAGVLGRFLSPLSGLAGVVSISALLTEWSQREARGRRIEIIEVPIVVDVDEQAPTEYPTGDPLVVFAGAPEYDDTIRFILAAMERVWQSVPECCLVLTGANPTDPAARWLIAESRRFSADPRVEVAGYLPRPELLRLYARAHALLIPLFDDVRSKARFPTKIGEYLAAARPVVTSAVGEIPRYFEDGANAVVCPPGDPAVFGDRLAGLLTDPAMASAIGRQGRALAEARFHYARHAETLYCGFASVIGRTTRSGGRPA